MIFFVLCPGFQGATLVSLILNNHSQLFALGDTNPTRRYDQRCACGERVSLCDFWQGLRRYADTDRFKSYENMLPTYPKFVRNHKVNQVLVLLCTKLPHLLKGPGGRMLKAVAEFREGYSSFLDYCKQEVSFSHFVDGEKSLLKYLMVRALGFDVGGAIHLVRDPRAYVVSRLRNMGQKDLGNTAFLDAAALEWKQIHSRIRKFSTKWPCHLLIYEQLVQNVDLEVANLLKFINVPHELLLTPSKDPRKHHLMGNKMLFSFNGVIRHDQSWREGLPLDSQERIKMLTDPLFTEFGYHA